MLVHTQSTGTGLNANILTSAYVGNSSVSLVLCVCHWFFFKRETPQTPTPDNHKIKSGERFPCTCVCFEPPEKYKDTHAGYVGWTIGSVLVEQKPRKSGNRAQTAGDCWIHGKAEMIADGTR
jgi:hypothetical protein